MKKKLLWTLGITTLLIVGIALFWKPILFKIYGIELPQVETQETVRNFIHDRSAHYNALAIPATKQDFDFLQKNFGMPGIVFFDKDLQPIKSSEGEGCQNSARAFIKELQKGKSFQPNFANIDIKNINDVLEKITLIEGDTTLLREQLQKKDFDFVAIYSWVKFSPHHAEQMMSVGEKALKNTKAKILIISLNLDFVKDWWGNEKIDIHF